MVVSTGAVAAQAHSSVEQRVCDSCEIKCLTFLDQSSISPQRDLLKQPQKKRHKMQSCSLLKVINLRDKSAVRADVPWSLDLLPDTG